MNDHLSPAPGLCGGTAGGGVSDLGTGDAGDAVLAVGLGRPGQYHPAPDRHGDGLDASRVHWHDELRDLGRAAGGVSPVDGGPDQSSGHDQFVVDGDVWLDRDGGVYDEQRGDHGQHHGDDRQSDVSGAGDEATAITYATTYVSVGAVTMQYQLDVLCEQVA
jgi:hypothetical protein